ncbi:MAG TPA: HEAT repeat domain-containing protein, partial [Gemmataceae bacterium]|nr:HEAT repeat domain-containing protein [Gemmataceae bacterium]
ENGLRDARPNVREHTVNAIAMAGAEAKSSADAVARLCADKEPQVRSAAYRALQRMKPVNPAPILKLLTHPELAVAMDAAGALEWLKPTGPEAVAPLVEAVKREAKEMDDAKDVAYIRAAAAEALGGVGKGAESTIPALVELLLKAKPEDVDKLVRPMKEGDKAANISGPVLALRNMGKPAADAVTPLLKNDEAIVRYQAAAVLSGMGPEAGPSLPAILAALEAERGLPGGQLYVFEELAAAALNLGAEPERITPVVTDLLKSESAITRLRACRLLIRLGRKAAPAVPKLIALLNDSESTIQYAAIEALAAIGPSAKEAVGELAKKVESIEPELARDAARALRAMGPAAAPAVPSLAKALESNDQGLCIDAAQTLAAIGPEAVGAVETLAKNLAKPETRRDERLALLQAVTAIGPAAKEAVPAITKLVGDRDSATRIAAAETLARIAPGNPDAVKKLVELLKDSQLNAQVAGLKALAGMGPAASSAAANIRPLLAKEGSIRVWAAATLTAFGTDADANAKIVIAALKDKAAAAQSAHMAAVEAVPLLGVKGAAGVPELIECLKEKTAVGRGEGGQLRERAARSLGKLGEHGKAAIPALSGMLKDPDRNARKAAAEALGLIGPEAVLAVPKLRDLAKNDPALADVAQAALDQIEPPKKME